MIFEARWTTAVPGCGRKAPAPSFPGMAIANVFTDEWDDEQEHEGFRIREAQIGPRLDAELIGGGGYEIDPRKKTSADPPPPPKEGRVRLPPGPPPLRAPPGGGGPLGGDGASFPP